MTEELKIHVHAPKDGTPTIYWPDGGQSALDLVKGMWFWRQLYEYFMGDDAHQKACNEVYQAEIEKNSIGR